MAVNNGLNLGVTPLAVTQGGTSGNTQAAGSEGLISGASLTSTTLDASDLVILQDISNSNALRTCTAQSVADFGGGGGEYAKAWIGTVGYIDEFYNLYNFILSSFNVDSISGFGFYNEGVTLTVPFSNTNYAVICSGNGVDVISGSPNFYSRAYGLVADYFVMEIQNENGPSYEPFDSWFVYSVAFGDQ